MPRGGGGVNLWLRRGAEWEGRSVSDGGQRPSLAGRWHCSRDLAIGGLSGWDANKANVSEKMDVSRIIEDVMSSTGGELWTRFEVKLC